MILAWEVILNEDPSRTAIGAPNKIYNEEPVEFESLHIKTHCTEKEYVKAWNVTTAVNELLEYKFLQWARNRWATFGKMHSTRHNAAFVQSFITLLNRRCWTCYAKKIPENFGRTWSKDFGHKCTNQWVVEVVASLKLNYWGTSELCRLTIEYQHVKWKNLFHILVKNIYWDCTDASRGEKLNKKPSRFRNNEPSHRNSSKGWSERWGSMQENKYEKTLFLVSIVQSKLQPLPGTKFEHDWCSTHKRHVQLCRAGDAALTIGRSDNFQKCNTRFRTEDLTPICQISHRLLGLLYYRT